jgi:hypothetical protein
VGEACWETRTLLPPREERGREFVADVMTGMRLVAPPVGVSNEAAVQRSRLRDGAIGTGDCWTSDMLPRFGLVKSELGTVRERKLGLVEGEIVVGMTSW